jgi:hypothetical protein
MDSGFGGANGSFGNMTAGALGGCSAMCFF